MSVAKGRKPVVWVADSRETLRTFPRTVKIKFGYALHEAQIGKKHPDAKPLRGFGGAGVLELVVVHAGSAFRGVYTVRFEGRVYVLHVFQKKSKHGIATPKKEMHLVRERLKWAERDHEIARKGNE